MSTFVFHNTHEIHQLKKALPRLRIIPATYMK